MSAIAIVVLIVGYLGFVAFMLALLTIARRSDEAAERQARAVAPQTEPLRRPHGAVRDADDDAFLEGLDRRTAREFESRRFVRDRTHVGKKAPRDS